jgi:hypothetical protein
MATPRTILVAAAVQTGSQNRVTGASIRQQDNVDPSASLREALAEKDPVRRALLLREWALSVPLDAIKPAMEQIAALSDQDLQSEARTALMTRWVAEDPKSAAAALQQNSDPLPGAPTGSLNWFMLLGLVADQ